MSVAQTEDDVFRGINFVEDVDHEVLELARVLGGGDEASDVERIDLAIFERARDFAVGVH